MPLRLLASLLFALAASVLLHTPVCAAYPDHLVRIVVPFAPGGGTDVVARTLAQEMQKDLGVTVIIENKPGAGTIIGTQGQSPPKNIAAPSATATVAAQGVPAHGCSSSPPEWLEDPTVIANHPHVKIAQPMAAPKMRPPRWS